MLRLSFSTNINWKYMKIMPEHFPVDVLHVEAKVNHRNGKRIALHQRGVTRDASDFDEPRHAYCTSSLPGSMDSSFDLQ